MLKIMLRIMLSIFFELLFSVSCIYFFANLTPDRNNLISLPILNGDNICFNYTINPAPDQHALTGVPSFPGRVYKIKIVVDDGTHVNTIPEY